YAYAMRAVFAQPMHEAWAIFDETTRARGGGRIAGPFRSWSDDLRAEMAAGVVHQGVTIEALAHSLDLPARHLAATVATWNEDVARGVDTLCGREVALKPIDRPPFYAARVTETNLGSLGGVKINPRDRPWTSMGSPSRVSTRA